MTRLSVNINKIATIRNARGGSMPDVQKAAQDCERFGAEGIGLLRTEHMFFADSKVKDFIHLLTTKNLRERKKQTQLELAKKIGVSDKTISKWETGKGLPDITLIESLAKSFKDKQVLFVDSLKTKRAKS
mgnify:CR=1 FL=1